MNNIMSDFEELLLGFRIFVPQTDSFSIYRLIDRCLMEYAAVPWCEMQCCITCDAEFQRFKCNSNAGGIETPWSTLRSVFRLQTWLKCHCTAVCTGFLTSVHSWLHVSGCTAARISGRGYVLRGLIRYEKQMVCKKHEFVCTLDHILLRCQLHCKLNGELCQWRNVLSIERTILRINTNEH